MCDITSIKVINKAGEVIKTIDCYVTGSGHIRSQPLFITFHKDHILVSDFSGNIHQLTKSGSYFKKLGVVNIQEARGLAVTAAQDLVIVDGEGPIRVLKGDETSLCSRRSWFRAMAAPNYPQEVWQSPGLARLL